MLVKSMPPDVRFYSHKTPNSLSAVAPPQTALRKLTALRRLLAIHLRGLLITSYGRKGNEREFERGVAISAQHVLVTAVRIRFCGHVTQATPPSDLQSFDIRQ